MKVIFEQLKDIILPVVTAIAVFALLAIVFPYIKQRAEEGNHSINYSEYQDSVVYERIATRQAPEISYNNQNVWKAGDSIDISQAFQAVDADGNNLDIRVEEITDSNGTVVTDKYNESEKEAVFDTAGSYFFRLKVVDQEKKTTQKTIALVVDN